MKIVANRPMAGSKKDGMGMPTIEQYLPPEYNSRTSLSIEVNSSARHDFKLAAKS